MTRWKQNAGTLWRITPKPTKKRKGPGPEELLQRSVKDYLDKCAPGLMWYSTPNGGMSKAQNGRNKAMGARAGVPDLSFILDGRIHYIELKAAKGTLSPEQIAFRDWCMDHAVPWAMCRSLEAVIDVLTGWNVRLTGRIAA